MELSTYSAVAPTALTLETLSGMKRLLENRDPVPVAIVVRPEFYRAVVAIFELAPSPDRPMAYAMAYGLDVYLDARQKESWRLFYDFAELQDYLNRPSD